MDTVKRLMEQALVGLQNIILLAHNSGLMAEMAKCLMLQ